MNIINEFIKTYSFDPDYRAKNAESAHNIVYPFALWSSEKEIDFNLTNFPDASSTFTPNDKFLKIFES